MVQAVAEFVEQGGDVVVREECGLFDTIYLYAIGKIAHQMGYRCLQLS